jgi:hypothetical protein
MNLKELNKSKWNDVIRPSILKRDYYTCQVCSIAHNTMVYINTLGNYVLCDDFIETWARSHGKNPFKIVLKVGTLDGSDYSEDPDNLISLCPIHFNNLRKDIFTSMREKLKRNCQLRNSNSSFHLIEWRNAVIIPLRQEIRSLSGYTITTLEASQIINNLINTIENVKD